MPTTLKNILQGNCCLQDKYIPDFDDLVKIVRQLKEGGFKIALTQGVYDMFHVGHGRYLAEARSHGDVLIVGVDSDELTRSMKGHNRPFDVFEERIEILSMLASVSVITCRHIDQHKYDLIRLVQPDVLIMSKTTSSFNDEDKRELDQYCGKIEHLAAKAATTTTAKTLRLMTEGAEELAKKIQATVAEHLQQSGVSHG
ncbi:MAG: adenylyltransferase/cytidyltransferase family protein [Patescibacteria group bacterium]